MAGKAPNSGLRWASAWRYLKEHQIWSGVLVGLLLAAILASFALAASAVRNLGPFTTHSLESEFLDVAWGPPRPIYHCNASGRCEGSDYVSLNSTVNTPAYGDERFFFSGKLEGDVGGVKDKLEVRPGDVLVLRIVVSNSGDPFHAARKLVAKGVTARVEQPRDPAEKFQVVAWLGADNASPKQIYDTLVISAQDPVRLHLVDGSARLRNAAHPEGVPLPDSLFQDGAQLGFRRLNGLLGPCFCEGGAIIAKAVVTDA